MPEVFYQLNRIFVALACLCILPACEEDEIDIGDKNYLDGGRGTNEDRGALEMRFSGFSEGGEVEYIEVYFSDVNGRQRIGEYGSKTVYFDNIRPAIYSYIIDVIEWRQSIGGSTGVSIGFGSGGISTSTGGALYSTPKYEHLFLDGTAEI